MKANSLILFGLPRFQVLLALAAILPFPVLPMLWEYNCFRSTNSFLRWYRQTASMWQPWYCVYRKRVHAPNPNLSPHHRISNTFLPKTHKTSVFIAFNITAQLITRRLSFQHCLMFVQNERCSFVWLITRMLQLPANSCLWSPQA